VWRRFCSEPFEVGEPELHQRPHLVLEPGLARRLERLEERLARLLGVHALLEPVVAGHEQLANLFARFLVQTFSFFVYVMRQ